LFVVLDSGPARKRLLAATADELLADAPVLFVPCLRLDAGDPGAHPAKRESMLLAGGAAIQNLMLALHALGLASSWTPSTLYCREEAREALGLGDEWIPLGVVAAGTPVGDASPPQPPVDVSEHMLELR
jgi:coenzyme F420-0:L-glutamate ligase/coenzyme F420-1:gamma-L-glutamate ligase